MKSGLIALMFAFVATTVQAQDPLGRVMLGFEGGWDVQQFDDLIIPRFVGGFQAEIGVGKFNLGAGISKSFFRSYDYYRYLGEQETVIEDGQEVIYYISDIMSFKPVYWTVPVKLDYRFHKCNCVYAHVAIIANFLDDKKPEELVFDNAKTREPVAGGLNRSLLMQARTINYEIGIGFKLFSIGKLRVYARPTYVISETPETYDGGVLNQSTLRIMFGAQYGLGENE